MVDITLEMIHNAGFIAAGNGSDGNTCADRMLLQSIKAYQCLYNKKGFNIPWVGYLAKLNDRYVGVCGFKGAPKSDSVEIAYFTFPGYERRGYAQKMARLLVEIAKEKAPEVMIRSRTLPQLNASTSVLLKNGFQKIGMVNDPEDGNVWEWMLPVH